MALSELFLVILLDAYHRDRRFLFSWHAILDKWVHVCSSKNLQFVVCFDFIEGKLFRKLQDVRSVLLLAEG